MKREIVYIDEELCNGCGECVPNCHEGALQIIDGKARLVSDLICDGLGACIGHCPLGAITMEEREAEPYDEIRVIKDMITKGKNTAACGCPGSAEKTFRQAPAKDSYAGPIPSALSHWPVQMHLINPASPHFMKSDFVLAADCTAFTIGGFHPGFLQGKTLGIACPKLDQGTDIYLHKLISLIENAQINTLTVMMMEVPCCGGLAQLAQMAVTQSSRKIPVKQILVSVQGEVLAEEWD